MKIDHELQDLRTGEARVSLVFRYSGTRKALAVLACIARMETWPLPCSIGRVKVGRGAFNVTIGRRKGGKRWVERGRGWV